jgi:hypothetical protein
VIVPSNFLDDLGVARSGFVERHRGEINAKAQRFNGGQHRTSNAEH